MFQRRLALLLLALGGCSDVSWEPSGRGPKGDDPSERPPAAEDRARDVEHVALRVNVETQEATATITVAAAESRALSLEVGELEILEVADDFGALAFERGERWLDIGVPATEEPTTVSIRYTYPELTGHRGATNNGLTLTWPYHCGNLFPCKSDPADGTTVELELLGVADDLVSVYPTHIDSQAPSYMIAWAIGEYTYDKLGETPSGTEVGVYHLPGEESATAIGTEHLVQAFDWLETTLGAYAFGDKVASVSADWGPGQFGGMEHHPLWHVASGAMDDGETHVHEAAHGWFGNGIRIACWEDFVLSEGTVSYLTARALEDVAGPGRGDEVWQGYRSRLNSVAGKIAWPEGCGEIDIIEDGLFSSAPYMKGAFFFRALAARIGKAELDAVLAEFYTEHVGTEARFEDLLDLIHQESGYDATDCAQAWLRGTSVPSDDECPPGGP